jgi:hypothetical protein
VLHKLEETPALADVIAFGDQRGRINNTERLRWRFLCNQRFSRDRRLPCHSYRNIGRTAALDNDYSHNEMIESKF